MNDIDLYALYRLARAATDQGYYNAAKLFNAAAAAFVNRQLYAESLPKTEADLIAAIRAVEPALAAAGLDASLLDSLQHVQTALTAGRLVLYEDAAPVFVCRVCGEVARDQAPEYCPTCGAGHLTYQDFSATYYLEPEPIPELLAQLALTPDWLDHILSDVPPERTTQKVSGVEGEWSLIEAAGHLLDAQDLIAFRVSLFLTNESPNLSAKPVWEMTDAAKLSAHQIADRFRRSRETMLARLRSADPAYWARVGQHAEFGPVTLQQQAGYFVKHEQWHMAQITRIRDALVHHT